MKRNKILDYGYTLWTIYRKNNKPILTNKYRTLIYLTYNKKCAYCGSKVKWQDYEADHIYPYDRGGKSIITNMACSCRPCNRKKHTKLWDIKYPANSFALMNANIAYITDKHFKLKHLL